MPLTDTVRHLILIFIPSSLAFFIALFSAKPFINLLHKYKIGKQIRETTPDGLKSELFSKLHAKKSGTPTMGGILIWATVLLVIIISQALAYFDIIERSIWNRNETYLPIFTLVTVALLGAIDDYFNIRGWGKSKGINVKPKMFWLTLFALAGGLWFYYKLGYNELHIPGIGDFTIGLWYIPLFIFIILASANSVNITDGLDGLAGGLIIIAFLGLGAISFAKGLFILSAFCGLITGGTLAFLWFNIPPAKFYMGDTGALALGATMGVIAMMTNSVVVLPFIGFIFVIETISVIIQLLSKKFRGGKKVFRIAPLHHHFEAIGWPESQIVMRFWTIGAIVGVFGIIIGLIGMGV